MVLENMSLPRVLERRGRRLEIPLLLQGRDREGSSRGEPVWKEEERRGRVDLADLRLPPRDPRTGTLRSDDKDRSNRTNASNDTSKDGSTRGSIYIH